MDVGRSPKLVLKAQAPDQRPQLRRDRWPSSAIPGLQAPVATEAVAMPAEQRLGPDDRDGVQCRRKPAMELDEEQTITVGQRYAAAYLAPQYNHLPPERGILGRKLAL